MKTVPFWTDAFPRPADLSSSELPHYVDVAVVGGGYTGLSAARVLAKNGASVAVLERHTIGWGASSRNGGLVTTGLKPSIQTVFKHFGPELAKATWKASLDAIDLMGEIIADEGIACDFRRQGHLVLATKPSHFRRLQKMARWLKFELDHSLKVVSPERLSSEIGTNAYAGALLDELSGSIHPAKYAFGLAKAAARHGVQLCENTSVTGFSLRSHGFEIRTNQGAMSASEVMMATNGYTDSMVPKLRRLVFPVGSYVIVTEPLPPETARAIDPHGRVYYDSRRLLNYFRLTPDGRMLFGGRHDLSTDLDLYESARSLQAQMVRIFPQLQDVPISHSWSGRLGMTFDQMPHIGRVSGVSYALGYSGHGVALSTYLGTEVGRLLTGQERSSPFVEIPHRTAFFYHRRPWFLPAQALYNRLVDNLT